MTDRSKPALALSGGGFRATLYHCGTLIRLNELGMLPGIERISSVSGGSIAAGALASAWADLGFQNGIAANLEAKVIRPLRDFCHKSIDRQAIAIGTITPGKTIGDVLAGLYDENLLHKKTLADLPDTPQFVFMATNLQTGRSVRLSKVRIADFTIGEIKNPKLSLAQAVTASSAFPPVLSPINVKLDAGAWSNFDGTFYFNVPAYKTKLMLTDGGAYDNLGLETVDDFATILISDAGAPFTPTPTPDTDPLKQTMRVLDIATDQARGLRKRLIMAEAAAAQPPRKVAYFGIDGVPSEYKVPLSLPIDAARVGALAGMRTRLDPFSDTEQGQLINWGYVMCDTAIRAFVNPAAPAATKWPCPNQPLG